MEQAEIVFNYNGLETNIQSDFNIKFKDIYKSFKFKTKAEQKNLVFMYNGFVIQNEELTCYELANDEDKRRKKMNILVNEIEEEEEIIQNSQDECIIKSKAIICPQCKENIKLKFENYIISLFDWKNKHKIDDILLDKFESTQTIDISIIICNNCKKYNKANVYNNEFYRCNICSINLCPICYSNHDKIIKLLIIMIKIIFVKSTINLIHNIAKIAKKIYAFIVKKIILIIT